AAGAAALAALAAPAVRADPIYTATFQGLTFTITQTDTDTLTLEISGVPTGDWVTVGDVGACELKAIGRNFKTAPAIANGPGASNLAGLNSQVPAANVFCSGGGSPRGAICFDVNDVTFGNQPIDFVYTIDFSAPLNIDDGGPHLQLVWTA